VKALLVGCGNIGAMYDYNSNQINSHAKAYSLRGIQVDFIEPKDDIAEKVITKYDYRRKKYSDINLSEYDILSICTPTQFHSELLKKALESEISVIICEKPIAGTNNELDELLPIYQNGNSKVLVNYIRRFHPNYKWLKNEISTWDEALSHINCIYYKGLMNYASHAMDIIEYLTSFKLEYSKIKEVRRVADYFDYDPTMTIHGNQNEVNFFFQGLTTNYPLFEFDLFFKSYRLRVFNGGLDIEIYKDNKKQLHKSNMLDSYMLHVIDEAIGLYKDKNRNDNFESSLGLNKALLNIIDKK